MSRHGFSFQSFGLRLLLAAVLVFVTYNPERWSYYHWAILDLPQVGPEQALAGILLLIGWVIYLRATLRSLGVPGIALVLALVGCLVWLLVSYGVLKTDSARAIAYVALTAITVLLGVGLRWSHIRRRLSGQVDTDDVETG